MLSLALLFLLRLCLLLLHKKRESESVSSLICVIFAEDKLHSAICKQAYIALLCIIFAAVEYIIRYRYGNEESFCHKWLRRSGILLRPRGKYHLPSPSSVNSALKRLLEKDFITQQDDAYVVYDKFFDLWLKNYMK